MGNALRFYLAILTIAVPGTFSQQRIATAMALDERDEAGILQEMRSTRGVDHWGSNDVLMGLTRPPNQPVRSIAEWEKAHAVFFAVDSDITSSLILNRKTKTANSPDNVYTRSQKVVAALNNLFCQAEDEADDESDDSDPRSVALAGKKKSPQCTNGALEPEYLDESFNRLAMAHDFFATISRLCRYVDVVLLIDSPRSDELEISQVVHRMQAFDAAKEVLASPHVLFLQARFDTKWIRDYGPLFVRDSSGAIVCVDTRYDLPSTSQNEMIKQIIASSRRTLAALQTSGAQQQASKDDAQEETTRLHDDQAPSNLAARLRQKDGSRLRPHPVSVVRPPIVLSGGDFFTDGQGLGFTSTRTLRDNGGNVEMLDLNFKKYLGIDQMVYLHPLPGDTIKHIDMFFQIASPNVILLGKFAGTGDGTPAERRLQSAAVAALEDNLEILRSHYEQIGKPVSVIDDDRITLDSRAVNIVRIPMPAVLRPEYSRVEAALNEYNVASKDYEDHEDLLQLITRFKDQLTELELGLRALSELAKEAAQKHPVDDHDLELLAVLTKSGSGASKALARYSSLTGEYELENKTLKADSDKLTAALTRLHAQAESAVDREEPLDTAAIAPASDATKALIHTALDFASHVQGDNDKDVSLAAASGRRMAEAIAKLQQVLKGSRYGSDLYRTFLNLLQVRTPGAVVLILPTYRDGALKPSGDVAERRIQSVFQQLYGNVVVVPAPSDTFIQELGSIHCLTKVLPEDVEFLKSSRNRLTAEPTQ